MGDSMSSKIKAGTSSSGVVLDADNTGILELQSGSTPTTAVTIDASQNVGVGTASPGFKLDVSVANARVSRFSYPSGAALYVYCNSSSSDISGIFSENAANNGYTMNSTSNYINMFTNGTERMRINSTGSILTGATSVTGLATGSAVNPGFIMTDGGAKGICTSQENTDCNFYMSKAAGYSSGIYVRFYVNNSQIGKIETNGSSTSYVTSSDYRLKEEIQPMTGALAKVAQLKPVTYKWKSDGSAGEGFVAHELQEICPLAVSGEKDALNKDGNIEPQGIDTSFLVATLTAAIQEQQALITTLQTQVAALQEKVGI
jgi:hypothetical protein